MWTVKRRFSVVAADSKERGTVGSYKTVYEAITKSHEDLATQMVSQKTEKGSLKTSVAEQLVKFDASQQQDVQAIGDRVAILQAEAEQWQTQVQTRSDEAQAISVNTLEVREETAARRTDVLRLRHELEEMRTDLFRLNEILRHDTDQLLRVELENQALDQRLQQLQQ